jgi:hypothetical protein
MHAVAKDLSSGMEANELRTTRLELDGELGRIFSQIDGVEHGLWAALETLAEDTHKVILGQLAQLGGQLKSSLAPLVELFSKTGGLTRH